MPLITGNNPELIKKMIEAGIVPDNCQRVIIDIQYDATVKLYYECLGDEKILDVDFASHIGAIITEKEKNKEPEPSGFVRYLDMDGNEIDKDGKIIHQKEENAKS